VSLERCFIGLGTNLGNKEANLKTAILMLDNKGTIWVKKVAPFYQTAPWGYPEQDWFINTVVEIETTLSPHQLLNVLLNVEEKMGRLRNLRWGPRIIDLDLLTYGSAIINRPGLVIPHPRMTKRAFVLVPLADLDPDLVIPGHGSVIDLTKEINKLQDVKRL